MRSTRYPKNILHMRWGQQCTQRTYYTWGAWGQQGTQRTYYTWGAWGQQGTQRTYYTWGAWNQQGTQRTYYIWGAWGQQGAWGGDQSSSVGALTWSSLKWFQSVVVRTKQNKNTQKRRRKTEREKKKKETDYDRHGPNSLLMVQVVLICAFTSSHNHHFDSPKFGPSLIERWPCVGSIECSTVWVRSVLTTKPRQALLDSTSVDSKELKNGPSPCLIQESNTANPV